MKVLYIAGATRSGSTLLHDILAQLDGFEGVGELRDIWQYGMIDNRLCGCGAPFRSCPFWSEIVADALGDVTPETVQEMARLTERFRTRDLLLSRSGRRDALVAELDPLLDALVALYAAVQRHTGCSVIVDSSKNPAFGHLVARSPQLDVRYVHLVRDSPAVAHSLAKRKASEPGRHLPRKRAWQSVSDWSFRNLAADVRLRDRPVLRLRYEECVAHPADALSQLCELVDERPDVDSVIDGSRVEMDVRPHSVFGNPDRFRHGPTDLERDDEWRRNMKKSTALGIQTATLPLRLRYGYVGAGKNM